MPTIEKRGKNSFRIGVQVKQDDGTFRWVREVFHATPGLSDAKQRKEAEVALAKLVASIDDGTRSAKAAPAAGITVRSFAEKWMAQHVAGNLSPVTYKNYRYFLDSRILPALGDVPLKRVSTQMLLDWLENVRKDGRRSTRLADDELKNKRRPSDVCRLAADEDRQRPLSPRTVQHYYDTLASMFDMAVQWGELKRNPLDSVTRPRARKGKANFLTEEQAVELLRALHKEKNMCFRAAVLLALLCGLRLGEVGALRLSDVDWAGGTIRISRNLIYTPQTGNVDSYTKTATAERYVTLPPGMMAVLHETRAYQEEVAAMIPHLWKGEGWIVHSWDGRQLHHDTPTRWFREFADRNGYTDVTFHDLRHTHATALLANNIDAVAVASRLGHKDASTTLRIYAHALQRRDVESARVWQQFLDAAGAPGEE